MLWQAFSLCYFVKGLNVATTIFELVSTVPPSLIVPVDGSQIKSYPSSAFVSNPVDESYVAFIQPSSN